MVVTALEITVPYVRVEQQQEFLIQQYFAKRPAGIKNVANASSSGKVEAILNLSLTM